MKRYTHLAILGVIVIIIAVVLSFSDELAVHVDNLRLSYLDSRITEYCDKYNAISDDLGIRYSELYHLEEKLALIEEDIESTGDYLFNLCNSTQNKEEINQLNLKLNKAYDTRKGILSSIYDIQLYIQNQIEWQNIVNEKLDKMCQEATELIQEMLKLQGFSYDYPADNNGGLFLCFVYRSFFGIN